MSPEGGGAPRRPLTRLAALGLAGHVFYELGCGVGMPLASVIGPAPAAGLWVGSTATAYRTAGSRSPDADRAFALVNGFGVAAVVAHLTGWPRRRTVAGVPWLLDCEGLGPGAMRVYNPILYLTGAVATAAALRENRSAPMWWRAAPLALVPVVRWAQHAEHRRMRRCAPTRPGWWNRRLRDGGQHP